MASYKLHNQQPEKHNLHVTAKDTPCKQLESVVLFVIKYQWPTSYVGTCRWEQRVNHQPTSSGTGRIIRLCYSIWLIWDNRRFRNRMVPGKATKLLLVYYPLVRSSDSRLFLIPAAFHPPPSFSPIPFGQPNSPSVRRLAQNVLMDQPIRPLMNIS